MDQRCVNPFVHRFHFRKSDYFKIFFGTIFLVPIRVILMLFLFVLTSMIAKFSNYLLDVWKLEKQEEIKWRNYFQIPCVYTLRAMFFISGFYKLKVVDKGGPNDEEEARIIVVAPHTSPFDLLCGICLKTPSVVARHDSVDIPFFGNIIKLTDPVFVQRDSQSSRNNVINSVLDKIKYFRIIFFPEGTCSNRRALVQFKPGAFKPGLPVQPIAVKYEQFGGPDTLSWTWDGPPAYKSIWLTLCRWSTGFELIKLPVYYPTEEEKIDSDLFARNLSILLSKELGLPNLNYSFDDVKCFQYKVFRSPVCLKFIKLCDKISNQSKPLNGTLINNNLHSNGSINSVNEDNHMPSKNKKQIFCENVNQIIRDVLERLELNSPQDIQSLNDLISLFYLDKYPELCKSITLKEFYNCIKISAQTPNTTHLSVVLQLCDMSVKSFWKRLENGFNSLANKRLNGESNNISNDSFKQLLWLAFGIEDIDDKLLLKNNNIITFELFKRNILRDFSDCVDENGRELLEELK